MGTVTSKAPNPAITDKNDARYTPLNDFDKMGLKTIVGGQDAILGGINVIGRQELQVRSYLVEGEKAEVGDTILMAGNRKGIIKSVVYTNDNPDVVLTITVIEHDIPQRNAASAQDLLDDGFIGQNTREVDLVFGLQTATGTDSDKIVGATTHTLILGSPTVIKKKTVDPATWNPIAQAMRKYQGAGLVTVTVNAFSDAGITPGVDGFDFVIENSGYSLSNADLVAGTADVELKSGVQYNFTDPGNSGADCEIQETGNGHFTPSDDPAQTITFHNFAGD